MSAANPLVKTADAVEWRDIEDVFEGRRIALRVPDFYPARVCEELFDRIVERSGHDSHAVSRKIKKVGKSIAEAAADPVAMQDYYDLVLEAHRDVRGLFHPYLAPMDKVRLLLQEVWPGGSQIERLNGLPMFCGVIRTFEEGAELLPHQDMTHWHLPDSTAAQSLITQGAANVHLSEADHGGELEIWGFKLRDKDDYAPFQTEGHYGLDRTLLGPPSVTIRPRRGDLLLFDARNVHAVRRNAGGVRMTSSAFIGYRGVSQPLTVYS